VALPNLAASGDLTARGVTVTSVHTVMLAVASSVVRAAAGSPILENESAVTLTGWGDRSLELPGKPVTAVSAVEVDGVAVTDFLLTDSGNLWCRDGWGCADDPVSVEVTMTHGLPTVPAHVVQLVCDLAIAGAAAAPDGAHDPRVVAERIDDYSVTFAQGAEAVASVMELPKMTRHWLRAQFGGGAGVVTYR
jgi:hypothetical protein